MTFPPIDSDNLLKELVGLVLVKLGRDNDLYLLQAHSRICQEALFLEEEKSTTKTNGLTERPRCDVSFLGNDLNKYLYSYWWKQHSEQKVTIETIKPPQSNPLKHHDPIEKIP